ncbi:hypothetical protein [Thermocrinis sp.]
MSETVLLIVLLILNIASAFIVFSMLEELRFIKEKLNNVRSDISSNIERNTSLITHGISLITQGMDKAKKEIEDKTDMQTNVLVERFKIELSRIEKNLQTEIDGVKNKTDYIVRLLKDPITEEDL